jgi:ribosomal protein L40E
VQKFETEVFMKAVYFKKAGRGRKSCINLNCNASIGARSLRCSKCGTAQLKPEKASIEESTRNIADLTVEDYQLILKLATEIKGGGPIEPEAPKPTAEEIIEAIGNNSKLKKLKRLLEDWESFESSGKVPARIRNRIRKAVDGLD